MVNVKYNKGQMDDFQYAINNAKKNLMQQAKVIVIASILDVQTTASAAGYAPYKTGHLARSITNKIRDLNSEIIGSVGSNLVYAAIQEYGGRAGRHGSVNIRPKYYLTRAVKDNTDKIRKRFNALKIFTKIK